jgi:arylsulfatase
MFGKSHETAAWEVSPSGPTDRWPTRSGFDKFYGFIGGETNQWSPSLYDGMTQLETPNTPGYHFMTDMTDKAITWMRTVKTLTPSKPFFMYFAPGATHAPHHVPKEWIAKYAGKFDQGWDKMREETLARQIALGVVPPGTKLAAKPADIRDWDSLTPEEQKLFSRQMEVYAGFGEYADTEVGRLVDAVDGLGQLDSTLVFYILGDNGASAEGGMSGLLNEMTYFNGVRESVADIMKHYERLGNPSTYPHMAAGWAVAGDAPFAWTKQVASSFGGTRNGMLVHWPKKIAKRAEVRTQFHHVIDVAPTILEAAGLPEPKFVNGVKQEPIQGVSMVYSFDDPKAQSRRKIQYFEIFGNRGIYSDGWFAGTVHRIPWAAHVQPPKLTEDKWELYDTRKDFSLSNDLAAANPAKLDELKNLFLKEAAKNQALPLDDRGLERMNAALVGRPDLMAGRTSLVLYPGMDAMTENVFINVKNRSMKITADLVVPEAGIGGVILAQGGRFGGWTVYVKDGLPTYEYNFLGQERSVIRASERLPTGMTTLSVDFAYDGNGLGKGGTVTLSIDGKAVSQGRIERTQPIAFSAEETADVGRDEATTVSPDYAAGDNHFKGQLSKVTVAVGPIGSAEPKLN